MDRIRSRILRELAVSKKSIWELLDSTEFLLRDFVAAIDDLLRSGLIEADGGKLGLTERGRGAVEEAPMRYRSYICDKCLGRRVIPGIGFDEVLREYSEIAKDRPLPDDEFCQGHMGEYDVIARVAFMHHYDDLHGKDIVIIGDDDLLSVALALTGLPSRICALDIDERIGDFIGRVNRERGLDIEFHKYDVRDPLPREFLGAFDVFSSEPLETMSGLRAFISRGVCCLGEGGAGYFGLTVAEASPKKWLEVERLVMEMNCAITDIIRGFSRYPTLYESVNYEGFVKELGIPVPENPGIRWYKSSLFRIEALGRPAWAIPPNESLRVDPVDPEEDITIIHRMKKA
jgi:predicted methyltransferase